MHLAGSAADAPDGGKIHDGACAPAEHPGQDRPVKGKHAAQIRVQHSSPVFVGKVGKKLLLGNAGAADQRVDAPEAGQHSVHTGVYLRGTGRVGGKHLRVAAHGPQRVPEGPGRGLVFAEMQRGLPAVFGKGMGAGAADAAGSAGDEDGLSHIM